jgi:hypothetical protein
LVVEEFLALVVSLELLDADWINRRIRTLWSNKVDFNLVAKDVERMCGC